jgi:Rad3-related DNA helicase
MSQYRFEQYFPFQNIRSEQRQAIDFALTSFLEKKKRVVVLEMGTGCGKSVTGVTIARYLQAAYEQGHQSVPLGGCYFLTTQKVLQEQYVKDFGGSKGGLRLLKSASGYCCNMFEGFPEEVSCAEIQRLLKSKAPVGLIYKSCGEICKFKTAREEFFDSPEGITNYAYFLASTTYTQEMQRRGLLILDEGHNIESAVASFVKIGFSNFFYRTVLGVKSPPVNAGQKVVYDWLVNTCRPRLKEVIYSESKKVNKSSDSTEALSLAKKLEVLKRNYNKIEHFIETYDPNVWVLDSSKTDTRGERVYEFKPIVVGEYCQRMLFSHCDRALILSATILDKNVFCESIGVAQEDVEFLRIPSPFSAKNRPVHYLPVGSMSKAMIDKTLPNMVNIIKMLLEQHKNDKGIIHCVNFRIAEHLYREIGPKRLLTHTSDDREEVIKFHLTSSEPTVLLSPSMMEGVDLADNASRFQILCKIPFPYLGDAAIKKRMERNPSWYNYQTVKSVVQSLGRSVRNETDYATSYILDRDWERFYRNSSSMFPAEFSDALQSDVEAV